MPGEASLSPVLPSPPASLAVWQPTGCSVRNLKNPNKQNANPTRRDCPEPRLPAGGNSPLVWQRERKGIGRPGRALRPGDKALRRSSPWTSQSPRPARGNGSTSVPQIPCRARLGAPRVSDLALRDLALGDFGTLSPPCCALSRHPCGLGVSQSRAPERRALSALRAGPFPPRAAAPLPPYRTPGWRGLSLPPPGLATPSGSSPGPPLSLGPLPEAISSLPPPPPRASLLKCSLPRCPPPIMARLGIRKGFCFSDFSLPQNRQA